MTAGERHFVAVSALATSVDAEAKALAADLGTLAYEERLKLAAGLPAIVLASVDGEVASALAGKLRARGHRVQLCRASEVVAAEAMVSLRRFRLDADGIDAGDARLSWGDISVFVHARQRRIVDSIEQVKDKKVALGRALLTGGLMMRKTTTREVVRRSEDYEQVLYLFRADGGTPWLLRERGTNYAGLGASLAPTAAASFAAAVDILRANASQARYDATLLRRSAIEDVDLFAWLIAHAPS